MKIGLVCPYRVRSPGGVQEHVRSLSKELRTSGHQVTIISPGYGNEKVGEELLFIGRTLKVPTPNKSWCHASIFFDTPVGSLRKIIGDYKFDLIHFHSPFVPFLCWQILHVSQSVNVATFHSEWKMTSDALLVDSLQFLLRPFLSKFKEKLSGVIAVSEVAKKSWAEIFDGSLPEKVIPNGVSLHRFNPQNRPHRVFGDKPTILYVGRIEERKGLHYLLKAFSVLQKRLPKVRLVVVGSGPLLMKHKLWVRKEELSGKVFFAGRVSDEELPSYYAGADVYCSPATEGESFGIVLLEAMASGIPLVAFDNPGYHEVLCDCPVTEVLVPCGNVPSLSDSLGKLVRDTKLREAVRQWGLEKVKRYDWSFVAKEVLDFYRQLM